MNIHIIRTVDCNNQLVIETINLINQIKIAKSQFNFKYYQEYFLSSFDLETIQIPEKNNKRKYDNKLHKIKEKNNWNLCGLDNDKHWA